jgi:hypothetical protein
VIHLANQSAMGSVSHSVNRWAKVMGSPLFRR